MRRNLMIAAFAVLMTVTGTVTALAFGNFGDWGEAESIEAHGAGAHADFNTAANEGCPFISPDGKMFFIASNRPGGLGGLDIWVSTRASADDPWSEPMNLGAPINSAANDFCPTIARDGKTFFFVSSRPGYCGDTPNADIYTTRFDSALKADSVAHLGCEVNSAWDEHSPFPINMPGAGPTLFYSSARPADVTDSPGDHDLYASPQSGGVYQAGVPLWEINSTANEGQPNVRRDGQELLFWSDRAGGLGGPDIYSSAKESPTSDWGTPTNLGPNVNSAAGETRPSLSWGGMKLYFGSTKAGGEGQSDIYVTTR